jgi:hypothetical protein
MDKLDLGEIMYNLEDQVKSAINSYPELKYKKISNGYLIYGNLKFRAKYEKLKMYEGNFEIEIEIDNKFPKVIPKIRETGNKVSDIFHKSYNGLLCLGVDTEIKLKLKCNPSIVNYIEKIVIPYFYSFLFWQDNGKVPYGEFSHGPEGVKEFFNDYLNLYSLKRILKLLAYSNAKKSIKGNNECPCGSGKKIRNCHQKQLNELNTIDIKNDFKNLNPYSRNITFLFPFTNEEIENILKLGKLEFYKY